MSKEKINQEELLEKIAQMTVLELSEFVKKLEEKFNIQAQMFTATAQTAAAQAETQAQANAGEEKSLYTLELENAGANKIQVIKLVKELTGKGLKESKDLVEGGLPAVLKENVVKADAEEIKKKFEAVGAKISLK